MGLSELKGESLRLFISILKEYSKKVNIISRGISDDQLNKLIQESLLLEKYISGEVVVDAGSGNGILGIPIAIINPEKEIVLVEPRKKKSEFLKYAVTELGLNNTRVIRSGIEKFVKDAIKERVTVVARGFPDNVKLVSYVNKGVAKELLLITSPDKIKKMAKGIEKSRQKIYNVPFRDNLKIIHIRNVSRET